MASIEEHAGVRRRSPVWIDPVDRHASEARIGTDGSRVEPDGLLRWAGEFLGGGLLADRFELQWRAAGLGRAALVAQFHWPRLNTRIGLGVEPALAHGLVDRLLGFDRLPAEGRLQITPVEWGIWSFALAKALDRLESIPGPLGPWDLLIDRVGPDRFDLTDLGPIVTWRLASQGRHDLGLAPALDSRVAPGALAHGTSQPSRPDPPRSANNRIYRASGRPSRGRSRCRAGLGKLRPGSLLLMEGSPLAGTPESPEGRLAPGHR